MPGCRWEAGETVPQPWARRKLAALLGVDVAHLVELLDGGTGAADAVPVDDDIEALELARRATASDVGNATLHHIELAGRVRPSCSR